MPHSRRLFLKTAGLTAIVTSAQARAASAKQDPEASAPRYAFFTAAEAVFIEAAVARLIPEDESGPGALEADVPGYIDKQLAGAWGAGERLFRDGPWHEGTATQGYQLPYTPAELFRTALRALLTEDKQAAGFAELTPQAQDAFLKALHEQTRDLGGVPSDTFFESLLAMTVEGFFSDPAYGGNKDMVSWKMIGFPGAYAAYYSYVDAHGMAFTRPPISIADNGRGVIHVHPEIDASSGNAQPSGRAHVEGGALRWPHVYPKPMLY